MKKDATANPNNTSCSVAKLLDINHLTSYRGIQSRYNCGSSLAFSKTGFHFLVKTLEKNIVTSLNKKDPKQRSSIQICYEAT